MRILITGGAGFVGANLALHFRERYPQAEILAFDNLKRRGSELNLTTLQSRDIRFHHGDIRQASDFDELPSCDLFLECAAEPSVHAGLDGSPRYLVDTNLVGTFNCLEFARRQTGHFVLLSTSRVYSLLPLREIALDETESRFEISPTQRLSGISSKGIAETFPTSTARSLYGATKLASEMLVQEYAFTYGVKAWINRCGVIAGPGQFGKVDQGVFTMWVANHVFGKDLSYMGFGGTGKQVRDLLHPSDLAELIELQWKNPKLGETFNVGGGREVSTSLREFTTLCEEVTGRKISVGSSPQTTTVDVPLYLSDCSKVTNAFGWTPKRSTQQIVRDIDSWISENRETLKPIFGGNS